MRHIVSAGIALLAALALAASALPWASAQSFEVEPPAEQPALFVSHAAAWETVGEYREGMIRVTDGARWGYADTSGALAVSPQFEEAGEFDLGAALVKQNGKTGLLRWDGEFLLEPKYDELTGLGCGVYLARRGEMWDLLSVTPFTTERGPSRELYSDQTSAVLTGQQLFLRGADGTVTALFLSAIPQLLESRRVPGWQFPLSAARQASFRDVAGKDWYDRWVDLAYNVGLMEGGGDGLFEPERALTVAETLHLAACLESRARRDDFHLQNSSGPLWYSSSVAYCEACGVIDPGQYAQADYDRPITRSEMAQIFASTTPVRSLGYVNSPDRVRVSIPDVAAVHPAAHAVYALYAKGILTGTDGTLAFHPQDSLTRAEAAAIVARIARPEQRARLW